MAWAGRMLDKMPAWLRWLVVLPVGVGSYLVVQIVIAVVHGLVESVGELSPIASMMGDYFPQLVNSAVGPYAFVRSGTRVAPAHRTVTAATLAVSVTVMTVGVLILALANLEMVGQRPGGLTWLLITGLIGVAAAIKAYVDCKAAEQSLR